MNIPALVQQSFDGINTFLKIIYLVGLERTKREDPTVHGGNERGVLPLCYKPIYTMTA